MATGLKKNKGLSLAFKQWQRSEFDVPSCSVSRRSLTLPLFLLQRPLGERVNSIDKCSAWRHFVGLFFIRTEFSKFKKVCQSFVGVQLLLLLLFKSSFLLFTLTQQKVHFGVDDTHTHTDRQRRRKKRGQTILFHFKIISRKTTDFEDLTFSVWKCMKLSVLFFFFFFRQWSKMFSCCHIPFRFWREVLVFFSCNKTEKKKRHIFSCKVKLTCYFNKASLLQQQRRPTSTSQIVQQFLIVIHFHQTNRGKTVLKLWLPMIKIKMRERERERGKKLLNFFFLMRKTNCLLHNSTFALLQHK